MGGNIFQRMFGHRWGDDMGPDGQRMQQWQARRESFHWGIPAPGQQRGRHDHRRQSMSAAPQQHRRPSMNAVPQQQHRAQHHRSSSFGLGPPGDGLRNSNSRAPSNGRGLARGHPLPSPQHPVRGMTPPRRSSMAENDHRQRSKSARLETPHQPHQPSAPPQGQFPFTVFGKGRQNRPDGTSRRSDMFGLGGRAQHDGQHVGNNIMKNYVVLSALKKGGMAEAVNIIQDQRSGNIYVQKCIPLRNQRDYKRARAEINTLLKITAHRCNDNLNAIVESEISEARRRCFIILEYCDLGTVEDSITSFRKRGIHGAESSAWNLLAGVANGLAFLHHGLKNGRRQVETEWDPICHLDLKPCNIFNSSKGAKHGHCRVVLADFGCAITSSDVERRIESPFTPECGTPGWYPPEGRMEGGGGRVPYYGPKTDIWQLGATVHVFCKLLKGPDRPSLALSRPCSGRYSDWINRVVKQLCHSDSNYRPSALGIAREAAVGFEQAVRVNGG